MPTEVTVEELGIFFLDGGAQRVYLLHPDLTLVFIYEILRMK